MSFKINTKSVLGKAKSPKVIKGGDIEKEALAEVEEVSEFSRKAKAEKDLFKSNTDANYFTVLTFNNSDQLDEFMEKLGLKPSDKQYLDGKAFAKKIGIEISTPDKVAPGAFRMNKGLDDLVM